MNAPVGHARLARHYAEVRRRLTAERPTPPKVALLLAPPIQQVAQPVDLGIPHVEHIIAWHQSTNAGLLYLATHTPAAIIRDVCAKHGISLPDLVGPTRKAFLMPARREAVYRLRVETRLSYPAIARRMGRADHTTARHHYHQYLDLAARGLA